MKTLLKLLIIAVLGLLLLQLSRFSEGVFNKEQISDFWDSEVYIGYRNSGYTPDYLFRSFPQLKKYPDNKILYYRMLNINEYSNRWVIEMEIVQRNDSRLNYIFYFELEKYLKINRIEERDNTTGNTKSYTSSEDLDSFLELYTTFIELYLMQP